MKDEKVSLEIAKILKEKNFDIAINGQYIEYNTDQIDPEYPDGGGPFSMKKGEVETSNDLIKNNNRSFGDFSCKNYTMYAAPSQPIVQKWLREIHNVHIGLDYDVHGWMFFITPIPNPSQEINWSNDNYKTYEDALEVGIKIALRDYVK